MRIVFSDTSKEPKEPKKPKIKMFCCNCSIRVGGFRNKAIEYEDGYYCGACHFKKVKEIRLKEKEDERTY